MFRRWTHAGLWMRLLEALKAPAAPPPLRAMEYWIRRLVRRSIWTLRRAKRSLLEIVRMEQLGFHTALPRYPFALPQPDLSEPVRRAIARVRDWKAEEAPPSGTLTALGRLRPSGGRKVQTRALTPP